MLVLSSGLTFPVDVSRETIERLAHYVGLIRKWNKAINLVAPSTLDEIWSRHIIDSSQLLAWRRSDHDHWVDFGSGGGLPALVLAIMAKGEGLDLKFSLLESDQRKSVFLNQVIRELDLAAVVQCDRVEKCAPMGSDIVSARAVAGLEVLCGWARLHLASGGRAIFPKGTRYVDEVEDARRNWTFDVIEVPSTTEPNSKVLILENIQHV